MTDDVLHAERTGDVLTLTINRPKAFNALNAAVLDGLADAVSDVATSGVRAIVVTGSGEKAFCAGADLKELADLDVDQARVLLARGQGVFRSLERCGVPVVAAVNGLALGGGFELVLSCTFAIVSHRASLGLPEAGLGLIPGYGGTQRLPRAVGPQVAAHVMLTGERISADRAHALGLAPLPPVAPEELLNSAHDVAARIVSKGPLAVRAILEAMDRGRDASLETGLALEASLAVAATAGAESTEGVAAFLERRDPRFPAPDATREAR
ncbi:enoyl-CoA hydratase/isomerase family protein [Streptomyces brasiliensis]|uniref:enoyl-CoA hydratase n=1 Tax=Streptomyces brasiliensis TaxID=1954 RepID=A0A917UL32_9ACTN|nr:enoyl-CoA hydratase-related protein [Streptomyces brasiliensis]GGJ65549.1 crotonase [Streptomyces brasiliensis]